MIRTALGTASQGDLGGLAVLSRPVTVVTPGATLVVGIACRFDPPGTATPPGTVKHGAESLTLIEGRADPSGELHVSLWALIGAGGGSASLTATLPDLPVSAALWVSELTGATATVTHDAPSDASDAGDASFFLVPAVYASDEEFAFVALGTAGPDSDNPGAWNLDFAVGQRRGTSIGTDVTIAEGHLGIHSAGSFTAGASGLTQRVYAAVAAGFEVAAMATGHSVAGDLAAGELAADLMAGETSGDLMAGNLTSELAAGEQTGELAGGDLAVELEVE